MKPLHRFFLNFSIFFIVGLIPNAIFKHNLNVITAFSVALGLSLGIYFWDKKDKTK
ncbi:hypothetical protein [Neobacillus vireti]|uniref:hypothetical protein n=1 Tax=Neobacillus vireti TaxID=220686 RepID=UPI0003F76D29|nr:hypothetical protein [Neobacillus vireti]